MSFDSFGDFLAMGGHGAYVWSAYAIAFVVIALNVALPIVGHRREIERQRASLAQEQ